MGYSRQSCRISFSISQRLQHASGTDAEQTEMRLDNLMWASSRSTSNWFCSRTRSRLNWYFLRVTARHNLFPDFRKLDRGDGNHCVELVPAFAPVQGQLLGAGRPANRARIQLICSLTDSPMTALPARFGYRINSTRSFCRHSRATAVAITADGAS
jgi:hypothetical protein